MVAEPVSYVWASFDKGRDVLSIELRDADYNIVRSWRDVSVREAVDKLNVFCGLKKDEARAFVESVRKLEDHYEYLLMEV